MTYRFACAVAIASLVTAATGANAQSPTGTELIKMLKAGGYVVVFRHARSPRDVPDARTANPDNTTRERQLDAAGRDDARAIGAAVKALGIPVAAVLTSPTYRARETARLAGWEHAQVVDELGDRGRSMQGVTEVEGAWLRKRVTELPEGTNTVLITHLPNITRAFPDNAAGIEDGDALVFTRGTDGARLVGRIQVGDWKTVR